jgi:hypothetical protein
MVQKKRKPTLNVKDPEAHRLAQAIAEETGETLTRAVTEALRERYQPRRLEPRSLTLQPLQPSWLPPEDPLRLRIRGPLSLVA